jgi:polyribonucleotide nucleotidyltransferase
VVNNAALEKEMLGLIEQDLRAAYAVPDKMALQGDRCRRPSRISVRGRREPAIRQPWVAGVFKD